MPAALQALSTGANLTAAIASSRHFEHKQIVSFNQVRGKCMISQDVFGY